MFIILFNSASWVIFHAFLSFADFFSKLTLLKIPSGIPSMSNYLDPVQVLHFVGPDLGPNFCKSYQ